MKKDIPFLKVEDVAIAVVPDGEVNEDTEWFVYLVNLKDEELEGAIVASCGYGQLDGKETRTSTLRHFFELIPKQTVVKIELIEKKLFGLSNEYWISFWIKGQMYDRKYVFVPESILETNFTEIPLLNKRGVMIV